MKSQVRMMIVITTRRNLQPSLSHSLSLAVSLGWLLMMLPLVYSLFLHYTIKRVLCYR